MRDKIRLILSYWIEYCKINNLIDYQFFDYTGYRQDYLRALEEIITSYKYEDDIQGLWVAMLTSMGWTSGNINVGNKTCPSLNESYRPKFFQIVKFVLEVLLPG